jgi:hypothetical protein
VLHTCRKSLILKVRKHVRALQKFFQRKLAKLVEVGELDDALRRRKLEEEGEWKERW